jgi:hypothetical protein
MDQAIRVPVFSPEGVAVRHFISVLKKKLKGMYNDTGIVPHMRMFICIIGGALLVILR